MCHDHLPVLLDGHQSKRPLFKKKWILVIVVHSVAAINVLGALQVNLVASLRM